ncbi:HI0074 family nucleotidyltransferase substrate-binding subunit [Geoalkalibacter halelectricus]|uniref:HI0074 family nucleotidyltransferase substrate-binding subunit n=1 Tax=Geoalkalibacter halelectricus TaxID=2847045 RepID=UPI00267004EB|nr:HI0074 family nucleotidyltransferase substrate-binding subunit [Geoalkalibacter halelectricus]MDO3377853.1 nucleotidyltransferase substrate binding protein [Geoalkalibacter halelectricus]
MDDKDVRWQQRFANYEKAYLRLEEAINQENLNELERNGLIQRFEFTLDLAWKVLKDFLQEKGFVFKPSPKDTLRMAQQGEYISYAQELIDGLEIRNELSHDYSGEKFERSEKILREQTFVALKKLYQFLKDESLR